jgi:hypothetical protein
LSLLYAFDLELKEVNQTSRNYYEVEKLLDSRDVVSIEERSD